MTTDKKISLFHTVSALNETQFEVVWKMLKGLTSDIIEVETLTSEEAEEYDIGFEEMTNGEYKTLEQIRTERNSRSD